MATIHENTTRPERVAVFVLLATLPTESVNHSLFPLILEVCWNLLHWRFGAYTFNHFNWGTYIWETDVAIRFIGSTEIMSPRALQVCHATESVARVAGERGVIHGFRLPTPRSGGRLW